MVTFFLYPTQNSAPLKLDFATFPFAHIGKFSKDHKLKITSIEDIAINKVHAISSRNRSRDYLDLMLCLGKILWTPQDIIKNYRLKFDVTLPAESLATSFTNIQSASNLPQFLGDVPWDTVVNFYMNQARLLHDNLISP